MNLSQLEKFFLEIELPTEPVPLAPGVTVTNNRLFVSSHITALKAHPGNKAYMPYYDRLLKYYHIITTGETF